MKNNKTKICPICNEEIKSSAIKCPYCHEYINKTKLIIQIVVSIFVVFLLAFLIIFNINNAKKDDSITNYQIEYKSIRNIDYKSERYEESIDYQFYRIKKLQDDFDSYIEENHTIKENDELFLLFLKNLEYLTIEFYLGDYIDTSRMRKNQFKLLYPGENIAMAFISSGYSGILQILYPDMEIINFAYSGEGYYTSTLDYEFLRFRYSDYLSESTKEYLKIKHIEQKDLNFNTFYVDGSTTPTKEELIYWVVYWQNFIKKYPRFKLNKEIKENLHTYTREIITRKYDDTITVLKINELYEMTKEGQEILQDAMSKFNKHSKEYKNIKKCYTYAKKHNFRFSYEELIKYEQL